MNKIKDGGPAFPVLWINDSDCNATAPNGAVVPPGAAEQLFGMTLRDYFAAKALVALFAQEANPRTGTEVEPFRADKQDHIDGVARVSYLLADAMLRARGAA